MSSDWGLNTLNPYIGIKSAISRGHQSVKVKDAVEMYTINAAFAMRQEHVAGSLATGKDADFVVIDTDIIDQNNADVIHKTRVLQTFWKTAIIMEVVPMIIIAMPTHESVLQTNLGVTYFAK